MRRNSLAWIVLGGCAFGLTTMELAACSSNSGGTGTPTTQTDATTTKDGQATGEGGAKEDGTAPKDGGTAEAAVDCGSKPSLHPRQASTADGGDGGPIMNFLCPFSSPKGVKPDYCKSGVEHCCVPFTVGVESTCQASCAGDGGAAFNGRDFECLDPIDCNSGVCCGIGQVLKDEACDEYFGKSFKGTKCAASCDDTADEFDICQSDDQCPSGKTCQAMSAVGAQFGFCQ